MGSRCSIGLGDICAHECVADDLLFLKYQLSVSLFVYMEILGSLMLCNSETPARVVEKGCIPQSDPRCFTRLGMHTATH
jgi:hypothetical protein